MQDSIGSKFDSKIDSYMEATLALILECYEPSIPDLFDIRKSNSKGCHNYKSLVTIRATVYVHCSTPKPP